MSCSASGSGLCDELITRPEKSGRLWCATVCDLKTSMMRRPWAVAPRRRRIRRRGKRWRKSKEKQKKTKV